MVVNLLSPNSNSVAVQCSQVASQKPYIILQTETMHLHGLLYIACTNCHCAEKIGNNSVEIPSRAPLLLVMDYEIVVGCLVGHDVRGTY